ncbi:hypothetical protein GCM10010145_47970 [Streptomyces ruber]|uniref:Uncharacterized protein n=2 Tax=Streptomyces TaxID=1883 RepID=A0A918BIW5_9ACTN|nr:hypothetical protein GCM10010145_47970 [Streptomyces ruber]
MGLVFTDRNGTYDAEHEGTVGGLRAHVEDVNGWQPGDPVKTASALLAALAADDTPCGRRWSTPFRTVSPRPAEQTEKGRMARESPSRGTDHDDGTGPRAGRKRDDESFVPDLRFRREGSSRWGEWKERQRWSRAARWAWGPQRSAGSPPRAPTWSSRT